MAWLMHSNSIKRARHLVDFEQMQKLPHLEWASHLVDEGNWAICAGRALQPHSENTAIVAGDTNNAVSLC